MNHLQYSKILFNAFNSTQNKKIKFIIKKNCLLYLSYLLGVFALLIAVATLKYLQTVLSKSEFKSLFIFGGLISAGIVFLTVIILTYAGYIAPWSGRYINNKKKMLHSIDKASFKVLFALGHWICKNTHSDYRFCV